MAGNSTLLRNKPIHGDMQVCLQHGMLIHVTINENIMLKNLAYKNHCGVTTLSKCFSTPHIVWWLMEQKWSNRYTLAQSTKFGTCTA